MIYALPQIVPDNNPVCISRRHVEVGATWNQPILLRNDGKETLTLSGAALESDDRGHFTFQGPDITTVPSRELATFLLRYAPTEAGWDAVVLTVDSNAENYPHLRIFILARAEPPGLDGGAYDPGPKPMEAAAFCEEPDGG